MIDVETAGFVIKRIAPTDALPPAGKFVFDERDKLSVGDLVLSVGATPLVDEHGLLLLDLDGARSLIKGVQGDSERITTSSPSLTVLSRSVIAWRSTLMQPPVIDWPTRLGSLVP
mgnify:CR=1 FL=1